MKSEHRHELKTNELRRISAHAGEYLQQHANQILIGLTVVLLVAAGAIFWMRSTGATATSGWSAMVSANSAEAFQNVADRYRGTAVADWARLRAAENNLENGLRLSFTDRAAATSDLNEAREEYETILKSNSAPEKVRERALFGLARTLETLADENTEPAAKAYELLLQEFPQTVYKEDAEKRIADLRSERTKQFYAWFHKQNPKPEDRAKPKDGPAAATPEGGADAGDGEIPLDAAQPPAEATPATDEPASDPSATDTPPTTNPADGAASDNPSPDSSGSEPPPADATSAPPADSGKDANSSP
jgi:hypothetical protein